MRFKIMVGLHKGLLCRFPVGRQFLLHMQFDAALLQREVRKMLWQYVQVICQGLCLRVHIDKYKTTPALTFYCLQVVLLVTHMGEIPARRDIFDGAIQLP